MDYKARFYSPYLMRFVQPDTLIPDPSNPQAWNRFGYVSNRPINLNDPTGHDPWWDDSFFYISEYVTAGIYQQSWCPCNFRGFYTGLLDKDNNDPYLSKGPAGIKNIEMNTPYGDPYGEPGRPKNDPRGYGLGLPGQDQNNMKVAEIAMARRIALRLKACEDVGCSATDEIIVAALAANASISPTKINTAFRNKDYFSKDGSFNWLTFLNEEESGDQDYDRKVLLKFFVMNIHNKTKRPSVNWKYIQGVIDAR